MKFTYLLVNFFTIIIPFIFSFHPKLQFHKQWRAFFPALIISALVFIIWDAWFTRLGVWHFNPKYVTGINLVNLPLEEVLFFICIPYACVFTYHCLNRFYNFSWNQNTENLVTVLLSISALAIGVLSIGKLYTSYTFISLALLCLILRFGFQVRWLSTAFSIYALLLFPFFIVNGILTGTGLEEPVVLYNNEENLGIRLLTIPVEDIFYGLELFLLNVALFFMFKRAAYRSGSQLTTGEQVRNC